MNLDKFQKIDGREALKRLVEGEEIYTDKGSKMRLDFENHQIVNGYGGAISLCPLQSILTRTWYVPKPFDVRQAMLERPNEWVGAFEVAENWYKVGFDTTFMQMACASISSEISVDLSEDRVFEVQLSNLINCIPIEDVPKEATR